MTKSIEDSRCTKLETGHLDDGWHTPLKRTFDVTVAGLGILVMSPLVALDALLIFLEDRGPVLFVQKRMGLSNTFFSILKFRSMRVAQLDDNGDVSTARGDVRITRIGSLHPPHLAR